MKKNLLFVLCCLPLLGTSCPVQSIGVTCSNNLNASSFGFTLTIPAGFVCSTTLPNPQLLLSVRYQQASTGFIAAVNLAPPVSDCNTNGMADATEIAGNPGLDANSDGMIDSCEGCAGDPICTELAPVTTAMNDTFRVFRYASPDPVFTSYLATTTLASGNVLGISVSVLSSVDDGSLLLTLNSILATFQTP